MYGVQRGTASAWDRCWYRCRCVHSLECSKHLVGTLVKHMVKHIALASRPSDQLGRKTVLCWSMLSPESILRTKLCAPVWTSEKCTRMHLVRLDCHCVQSCGDIYAATAGFALLSAAAGDEHSHSPPQAAYCSMPSDLKMAATAPGGADSDYSPPPEASSSEFSDPELSMPAPEPDRACAQLARSLSCAPSLSDLSDPDVSPAAPMRSTARSRGSRDRGRAGCELSLPEAGATPAGSPFALRSSTSPAATGLTFAGMVPLPSPLYAHSSHAHSSERCSNAGERSMSARHPAARSLELPRTVSSHCGNVQASGLEFSVADLSPAASQPALSSDERASAHSSSIGGSLHNPAAESAHLTAKQPHCERALGPADVPPAGYIPTPNPLFAHSSDGCSKRSRLGSSDATRADCGYSAVIIQPNPLFSRSSSGQDSVRVGQLDAAGLRSRSPSSSQDGTHASASPSLRAHSPPLLASLATAREVEPSAAASNTPRLSGRQSVPAAALLSVGSIMPLPLPASSSTTSPSLATYDATLGRELDAGADATPRSLVRETVSRIEARLSTPLRADLLPVPGRHSSLTPSEVHIQLEPNVPVVSVTLAEAEAQPAGGQLLAMQRSAVRRNSDESASQRHLEAHPRIESSARVPRAAGLVASPVDACEDDTSAEALYEAEKPAASQAFAMHAHPYSVPEPAPADATPDTAARSLTSHSPSVRIQLPGTGDPSADCVSSCDGSAPRGEGSTRSNPSAPASTDHVASGQRGSSIGAYQLSGRVSMALSQALSGAASSDNSCSSDNQDGDVAALHSAGQTQQTSAQGASVDSAAHPAPHAHASSAAHPRVLDVLKSAVSSIPAGVASALSGLAAMSGLANAPADDATAGAEVSPEVSSAGSVDSEQSAPAATPAAPAEPPVEAPPVRVHSWRDCDARTAASSERAASELGSTVSSAGSAAPYPTSVAPGAVAPLERASSGSFFGEESVRIAAVPDRAATARDSAWFGSEAGVPLVRFAHGSKDAGQSDDGRCHAGASRAKRRWGRIASERQGMLASVRPPDASTTGKANDTHEVSTLADGPQRSQRSRCVGLSCV